VDEKQKENLLFHMKQVATVVESRIISPRETSEYIHLWMEQLQSDWDATH
jgi:hypothetical protein